MLVAIDNVWSAKKKKYLHCIFRLNVHVFIALGILVLYKKPFLFMNFIITFFLQMMNKEFGGSVHKKDTREDGQFTITVDPSVSLYRWESVHSCFPFYTLCNI